MKISTLIEEELSFLRDNIILSMDAANQVVSGRTKESLAINVINPYNVALEGADYIGVLERGRQPSPVPAGQEFIEILKQWIITKGLSFKDEADLERFANAIKWNLIHNGSKLYRDGIDMDVFTTNIEEFERSLSGKLSNLVIVDIMNNIFDE